MATIPQKQLRNEVAAVLRRAEAGEELTITVSGRPVAQIGPLRARVWVPAAELAPLWKTPTDDHLIEDLAHFGSTLQDPWSG